MFKLQTKPAFNCQYYSFSTTNNCSDSVITFIVYYFHVLALLLWQSVDIGKYKVMYCSMVKFLLVCINRFVYWFISKSFL